MALLTSILALGLILGLGNQFGARAAGCYGAITSTPSPQKETSATTKPKQGRLQVLEDSGEGKERLDTKDGIPQDAIEQ